ncbi:MAG: hypothetical protein L3J20_07525 [Flavobacteriaceae bacterium]|nr:hypothetical protein [Flavobacteriaceae bacterium]
MKKDRLQHIKSTKSSFKVPKGYFDTVEDAVFTKLSTKKLSEKEGFSMPDSYFNTVEDRVLEKIKKENSSQSAIPIGSQTGFTIPENYLTTIEDIVTTKLNDDTKPVKVIGFKAFLLKRVIPFAAAAAVLLLVYINYNAKTSSNSFDTVAYSDIEQWIENDLITFDTYEIAEVYNDIELENATIFAEDELLEYLDGTDIESLLLEN